MDFKFLNDRYMKGKEAVETYMNLNSHHKLQHHDAVVMGHSTIVDMQASMGANGILGLVVGSNIFYV